MRYVLARLEDEQRTMKYRFYVSNALQLIPQNKWCAKSLYDIMYPKPEDNKSGDEIAFEVIKKAGLSFKG